MEFCPICRKILSIKEWKGKHVYYCNCGFLRPEEAQLSSKEEVKNIKVGEGVIKNENKDAGVDFICKKCGISKAEILDLGERQSNESNVYLYKCLNCGTVSRGSEGKGAL